MISFELMINSVSIVMALAGMAFVLRVIQKGGHDRAPDPARVARVIRTAPYERLDNVLAK